MSRLVPLTAILTDGTTPLTNAPMEITRVITADIIIPVFTMLLKSFQVQSFQDRCWVHQTE